MTSSWRSSPALAFTAAELDFAGADDEDETAQEVRLRQANRNQFARLMSDIPDDAPTYSSTGRNLWTEYRAVLQQAVPAVSALHPEERAALADARVFLTSTDEPCWPAYADGRRTRPTPMRHSTGSAQLRSFSRSRRGRSRGRRAPGRTRLSGPGSPGQAATARSARPAGRPKGLQNQAGSARISWSLRQSGSAVRPPARCRRRFGGW